MSDSDDLFRKILDIFLNKSSGLTAKFLQYQHRGSCINPCKDCPARNKRIYENGNEVKLPAHPHCDCYYTNVETKAVGTISTRQPAPDVWLKAFGELPDYYITKEEAEQLYGWTRGKDLSKLAPGKMIGGDIYYNNKHILPEKEGRIWYECDIDYTNGKKRNPLRLYYSNDGLMFYSPNHLDGNVTVYLVE